MVPPPSLAVSSEKGILIIFKQFNLWRRPPRSWSGGIVGNSLLLPKGFANQVEIAGNQIVQQPACCANIYESEDTTHFSVVDGEGNMVSVTYTLEQSYGSRIVAQGGGYLLNNEMGDFNPIAGVTTRTGQVGTPPNLIAPEKRMLSNMSPTIVAQNGKPLMALGSPGGRTIINTSLQLILNVIDHGMDIAQSVEAGRIHHQWLPDSTSVEPGQLSPDTLRIYQEYGHRLQSRGEQGSAMVVYHDREAGLFHGAADSRQGDGAAVGY